MGGWIGVMHSDKGNDITGAQEAFGVFKLDMFENAFVTVG